MTAGRRVLLSVAFLGAAALLSTTPARAQERSHKVWGAPLTPDQVRAALARLSAGEGADPFQDMVKDFLLKNNPGIDEKTAEDTIRKLTGDKKLMEQLKQFAKQKQTDPGRVGRLTPEELADLIRNQRDKGELPKLPDNIKIFDNPKNPPGGDPKVNPDPKIGPMPKADPVPKTDPPDAPPKPADPPAKDNIKLDENPFPPPDEPTDPRAKSLDALTSLWERNIGSLDESPELRRALMGLLNNDGFDFDVKDASGNSLWDLLKNGGGEGEGFGDLFNDSMTGAGGGKWDFGNWEWPKFGSWFGGTSTRPDTGSSNWFGDGSSRPRPGSGSGSGWGSGGFGVGGGGGAWLPFVLLLLVVLAVVVWLKLKHMAGAVPAGALAGGLGAWPVDPRAINTREDVVLAFEYLSVLICGPAAKNWTHGTIAGALADLAATHEREALGLARLYELARYAPLDEPLTRAEVLEARELVCSLAGVS